MNFENLVNNIKSEKYRQKSFNGFFERQMAMEKRFIKEAKSKEPDANWYHRVYDKGGVE